MPPESTIRIAKWVYALAGLSLAAGDSQFSISDPGRRPTHFLSSYGRDPRSVDHDPQQVPTRKAGPSGSL